MKVQEVKNVEVFHRAQGVQARKLIDNSEIQLVQIVIAVGESLPKHKSPFDIYVYTIEGKGVMETDTEQVEISPDVLYELESNVLHGITNTGDTHLKLLVGKLVRTKKA